MVHWQLDRWGYVYATIDALFINVKVLTEPLESFMK